MIKRKFGIVVFFGHRGWVMVVVVVKSAVVSITWHDHCRFSDGVIFTDEDIGGER